MTYREDVVAHLMALGRQLRRRTAVRQLTLGLAAVLTLWAVLATADVVFRYGLTGRIVGSSMLWLSAVAALAAAAQVWRQPWTPEAVAARVERAFPELDNRLINRVQFVRSAWRDAMIEAYLREPPPPLDQMPISRLGDPRRARQAVAALLIGLGLGVAGYLWGGAAWVNSALRMANPFSTRSPVTLATIEAVEPGHGAVLVGEPATLRVKAKGRAGVPVVLDLWPRDDRRTRIELGRLPGGSSAELSHRLPRVAADFEYRFIVGDAVTPRYRLVAIPPPAFRGLDVEVRPPAYLRAQPRRIVALRERVVAPEGSTLVLTAAANRAMVEASVVTGLSTVRLDRARGEDLWWGELPAAGGRWTVGIRDSHGFVGSASFDVEVVPDPPPKVEIIAPRGRVRLEAGATPAIEFVATDDLGLVRVTICRLTPWDTQTPSRVVAEWNPNGAPTFQQRWTDREAARPEPGRPWMYRVEATDNLPGAKHPRAVSAAVVFEPGTTSGGAAASTTEVAAAASSLSRMVELQKANLAKTTALEQQKVATADAWQAVANVQKEIFQIAESLLADPTKPLGALAQVVRDLHAGPMREVIGVAARVPSAADLERPMLMRRAVTLESAILRALTAAAGAVDRVATHRKITGILAMLDALVQGQADVLHATKELQPGQVAAGLVTRQDRLAEDTSEFARTAAREAEAMRTVDEDFARRLGEVAKECDTRQVPRTMLGAAGHLEQKAPERALPLQEKALADLREFQSRLNEWRAAQAQAQHEAVQQALEAARESMKRLAELQGKVVDAIRQTEQQKDKSDKEMEEFLEELGEIKANMAEALLKIATDLHIFPELPVGNDLVADVYQIYEEVAQVPGSESTPASELGLQKEDWILEALETATERLDDMEMWMVSQPDAVKRNTENFDQQELPQIPVIPLPTELEDIIGDLLEQQEDIMQQADDSATNQGSADMPAGWGIAEGEFANFSAKGKSGNERPDHKDQDGRSLVGREGMSDGETVAGSGKINEGDRNIEARRTQDSAQAGQVQEEGHAEARATGGGKGSGYSDRLGMSGTGRREDAKTEARSELGLQALLRRSAEALYARASMAHIRTGSLEDAVRAMRQAEEAMRRGAPIYEVREFQRRAAQALARARMELGAGAYVPVPTGPARPLMGADDAAPVEAAPPAYRDLVAEYFRLLSETAP